MPKAAFIPKQYRPAVPGSKLHMFNQSNSNYDPVKDQSRSGLLIISARDDIVPRNFLKEIESPEVTQLYYDQLGYNWDFSFSEGVLKVYFQDQTILPTAIYQRHPGVSVDHPMYHKHIALFEVLDIWKGNLVGQRRDHFQNFSKGYQGITSVRSSSALVEKKVKYPKSFFIKGNYQKLKEKFKGSLIVKSCSNMRSRVVSDEVFSEWNMSNVFNLPTFFQEKISGVDIRVHFCKKAFWALAVERKDCVDYRYASKGFVTYREIDLPFFVKNFCVYMSDCEKNDFIGVDLMKVNNQYYCFESNPGPGWSTYSHPTKKSFAKKLFEKLTRN